MIHHKITSLDQFIGFETKKHGKHFANLHEVLSMLMDLDVKNKDNAELRYSSVHLVPCANRENMGRTALVYYNDVDQQLESNSYIVDFIDIKDVDWKQVEKENYLFWVH